MFITSFAQLEVVMTQRVSEAIENVLERAFDVLQDEIVAAGIPANSGGLYEAWDKKVIPGIKSVVATLSYDPSKLVLEQLPFPYGRHGSTLAGNLGMGNAPNDVRPGFAEIIFQGLAPIIPSLGQAGGTQEAKDAWTPFIAQLSSNIDSWIASELRAVGFMI